MRAGNMMTRRIRLSSAAALVFRKTPEIPQPAAGIVRKM
jgi:hypothetical protein